jgi:hypothetical protein
MSSSRNVQLVDAGCSILEQCRLFVSAGIPDNVFDRIPERNESAATRIERVVALHHAVVGAESLDRRFDKGLPSLRQLPVANFIFPVFETDMTIFEVISSGIGTMGII